MTTRQPPLQLSARRLARLERRIRAWRWRFVAEAWPIGAVPDDIVLIDAVAERLLQRARDAAVDPAPE